MPTHILTLFIADYNTVPLHGKIEYMTRNKRYQGLDKAIIEKRMERTQMIRVTHRAINLEYKNNDKT